MKWMSLYIAAYSLHLEISASCRLPTYIFDALGVCFIHGYCSEWNLLINGGINIVGLIQKFVELLYEIKTTKVSSDPNSYYEKYVVIGTTLGEMAGKLIDYKPEHFEGHFSPQDYNC